MNKDYYKSTFSKLHPSDLTVERIFDMSEKKPIRFCKKSIIALAVILSIFLATCICADAATDGALRKEMKTILNGEEKTKSAEFEEKTKSDEYDHIAKYESLTDENGNKVTKMVIEDLDGNPVEECIFTKSVSSENWNDEVNTVFYLKEVVNNDTEKSYDIVIK